VLLVSSKETENGPSQQSVPVGKNDRKGSSILHSVADLGTSQPVGMGEEDTRYTSKKEGRRVKSSDLIVP